ncbi:oxidoreductase [Flavobacterium sp.]|uniref:WD40/YVTN/BNR-like repeat-containing protein n=1 Tax=Flavobacterium sp. TaxID=239 RepID=UPI00326525B8
MKNLNLGFVVFLLFVSLKSRSQSSSDIFKSVSVEIVLKNRINIRAITLSENNCAIWYCGSDKKIGFITNLARIETQLADLPYNFDFRSIAQTKDNIFALSTGNPAVLFKYSKDLTTRRQVYEEHADKVFYDSMNFWNDQEGIAVGDPIENCFCIIITRDGGETWNKIPCEKLPKTVDGEAAFAASNSNICIKGDKTWIVSGGKKSRVFYSPDKGITWKVFETPIVQGKEMTGIFTADFYNEKIGVIAGGDFQAPDQNFQNKAITFDGGKTWKLIAENSGFGYASCIQFVPKSNGKQLVAIGLNGLYYSADSGNTWSQLLEDQSLYTIRFLDEKNAVAAGKYKMVRIEFKK